MQEIGHACKDPPPPHGRAGFKTRSAMRMAGMGGALGDDASSEEDSEEEGDESEEGSKGRTTSSSRKT